MTETEKPIISSVINLCQIIEVRIGYHNPRRLTISPNKCRYNQFNIKTITSTMMGFFFLYAVTNLSPLITTVRSAFRFKYPIKSIYFSTVIETQPWPRK